MPILHIAINIIGDAEIFPIVPYDMIMKAGLPSEFYLFLFGIMRHGILNLEMICETLPHESVETSQCGVSTQCGDNLIIKCM